MTPGMLRMTWERAQDDTACPPFDAARGVYPERSRRARSAQGDTWESYINVRGARAAEACSAIASATSWRTFSLVAG
jgi:hypothetical protein